MYGWNILISCLYARLQRKIFLYDCGSSHSCVSILHIQVNDLDFNITKLKYFYGISIHLDLHFVYLL